MAGTDAFLCPSQNHPLLSKLIKKCTTFIDPDTCNQAENKMKELIYELKKSYTAENIKRSEIISVNNENLSFKSEAHYQFNYFI